MIYGSCRKRSGCALDNSFDDSDWLSLIVFEYVSSMDIQVELPRKEIYKSVEINIYEDQEQEIEKSLE
jgi:hypothetical protein